MGIKCYMGESAMKINGPDMESQEDFQMRVNEQRHLMAETMGKIKHERWEAAEWKTYVQRHPESCLLAGAALGWILGRRLHSVRQSPLSSTRPQTPAQPSAGADKVVSAVLAEALPLIAAKMRRFSDVRNQRIAGG